MWDVVIVGAGPAGMAAALYTGRAKLKTLLLDRAGMGGGQLMNTELIEDYPAIKSITGSDMARAFEEQIREFGVEVSWGEVTGFEVRGNRRIVKTEDGTEYLAKAVIVSTGGLPRKLDVPGEAEFAGRGVSYCAICDGAFFKNQVLAVVGGGDSAVEEGTFLTRYAEKVYIIHRRDDWRAQKLLKERALANPKIVPIWNTVVDEIGGTNKVEWLKLRDVNSGEERRIDVGGVFIYVGFMPNSDVFGHEFPRDDQGFIITDDKMETPVPGIYVAGDVRSQYVRQISNAVGDATTAAVAATRYIEEIDATGDPEEAESVERLFVQA
ncbi:MAG TPA: thioredoxin-disulfide reductase [Chloroflexota bacterium]